MLRLLQTSLVLLAVAGFLFQSVWAGVPDGHRLCIGCERDGEWGWTISEPCVPGVPECCEQEHDLDPVEVGPAPMTHGANECGCIDVPLGGVRAIAVSGSIRSDLSVSECFNGTLPAPGVLTADGVFASHYPTCWISAAPLWWAGTPPRLLTPLFRWTVLGV